MLGFCVKIYSEGSQFFIRMSFEYYGEKTDGTLYYVSSGLCGIK